MLSATLERATGYLAGIRSHSVHAKGIRFDYLEGGSGPTVILLHGLAANKSASRPIMLQLVEHYRILALDVPGISVVKQLPSKRCSLRHLSDWLHLFVDTMELSHIHLAGHSLSAGLAAYYASKHTSIVTSLALASLPQWYASPEMKSPVLFSLPETLDKSSTPFETYMDFIFYKKPFTPLLMKKAKEFILAHYRPQIDFLLKEYQQSMTQLQSRLLQIQCDVLLLDGIYDRFQSADLHHDLRKYLPHARLAQIPSSGHLPFLENPSATTQALLSFLSDCNGKHSKLAVF